MKKIRVLECIRQGSIGGGERHLIDLSISLDKTQFEPIVLSFTDGPMVDALKAQGIKTNIIPSLRAFDISTWGKVRKLIIKEKIDIVHAHGTRANTNIFWAAKMTRKPLIYSIHGWSFHPDQSSKKRRTIELIEKFLTNLADVNISVSKSNQADGITRFKMPRSIVIYYGINHEVFNPNKEEFKDIRKEFGIPSDYTIVLFMVRMTLQKDPFTILRAFKIVTERIQNIVLLMVGDGDLKEEAKSLAKELAVEDHVKFVNFRQDVPDFLHAGDIYCLPSLWEGLPIGLLEAMFMKKAIIATPVDGTKEVITDHFNGILIPVQNPDKLADAIAELAKNKELRNELAENAFNTVQVTLKDQFSIPRMSREVEKIYLAELAKKNNHIPR